MLEVIKIIKEVLDEFNFNDLPRSVVFNIMAYLSLRDARQFSYTSKKIRSYFRIYQEYIGADENNNVNCTKCFNCIDCINCHNCDNCNKRFFVIWNFPIKKVFNFW